MLLTLDNISEEQVRKLKENNIIISYEGDEVFVDINGDNTKRILEALHPADEITKYGEEKITEFRNEHK